MPGRSLATAAAPAQCSSSRIHMASRSGRQRPLRRAAAADDAAAAVTPPPAAAAPSKRQQGQQAPVPVTFMLGGREVAVDVAPGTNIWEAAKDAGADITLGCSQGSCGVCEVEVWKYSAAAGGVKFPPPPSVGVVRACIAGVPPGYERLEVREVPLDDIWGVDGFDT